MTEEREINGGGRFEKVMKNEGFETFARRIDMLDKLKRGGRYNIKMFRSMYGVAKGTALNDMACLSTFYPIEVHVGRAGGYRYVGERELPFKESAFRQLLADMDAQGVTFSPEVMAELTRLKAYFSDNGQ